MTQATAQAADAAAAEAAGEAYRTPVRRVDVRDEIARLETYVGRMERRYEYGSDEMLERLQSGVQKCTAEISQWLMRRRTLLRLREEIDRPAGAGSATTG